MLNWRRAESPLELSIEILLAAIADEQRYRLDLHAVANQRGGAVESHRRQPLMHRHADHAPEHAAQIRALAMQLRGQRMQCDRLGIRLLDAIQYPAHVFLRR